MASSSSSRRGSDAFATVLTWIVGKLPNAAVRGLSRCKRAFRYRRASKSVSNLINQHFTSGATATVLAATGDTAVFRVDQLAEPPLILKIAHTAPARRQLDNEAQALDKLNAILSQKCGCGAPGISAVIARGSHQGETWFTQSLVGGVQTFDLTGIEDAQLVAAAANALLPIHNTTAEMRTMDGPTLDRTVITPLQTLETWRPQLRAPLLAIGAALTESLEDAALHVCRLHGDFGPTNTLWDPATITVSGIVDWSFDDQPLPPEMDLVHFVIALSSERTRQEYGATVVQMLDDTDGLSNRALVESTLRLGPNWLDATTALTLAWLHHVATGLSKQEQLRGNEIWLQRNVDAVVRALSVHLCRGLRVV